MKPVRTPPLRRRSARLAWPAMARALVLVAALVLLLMLLVLWLLGARAGLESMRALLTTGKPHLVAVHFLLIGCCWLRWAQIIGWGNRLWPVPDSFREALIAARHRAARWLLAFELIVVVGLPSLLGGPHS